MSVAGSMRNPAKKTKKEEMPKVNVAKMKASAQKSKKSSLCHLLHSRTLGRSQNFTEIANELLIQRVSTEAPLFMRCRNLDMGTVDKVFCSRWIDSNVIVAGTKCNSLKLIRLETFAIHDIPLIPSINDRSPSLGPRGGIHGMDIDPSGTFLATSGFYENEVNIFDVKTLTPRIAFSGGHTDWVFDIRWLTDRRLVSCSRDGSLAVWSLDKYLDNQDSLDEHGATLRQRYFFDTPVYQTVIKLQGGSETPLRAMAYSRNINRLSLVTTRKALQVLDTDRSDLSQIRSITMEPCCNETVTAATNPLDPWVTAVGSQSHVNLYDIRDHNGVVRNFRSKHCSFGVRSLQFNDHMLSYSTGRGSIFFFDVRADHHLDLNRRAFSVNLGKLPEIDDRQMSNWSLPYPCVAIYTHEYDHSRTRIFCAGGPLAACDTGSYASLWW